MALINQGRLTALESVVNRALELDPMARQRLESLAGKSIRLQCTDPDIDLCVAVEGQSIQLMLVGEGDAPTTTAHLSGDMSAFIRLLTAEDKAAEMINADLRLQGESSLLIDLQDILAHVELDWEYHLARVIGDLPAHALGKFSRETLQWLKSTQPVFLRHVQEFVLEEGRLAPTQAEMDAFIDEIHVLDERVERLQARLQRLHARVLKRQTPENF
ncbi:Uncharacterised protein [BD1-7 clade bacterium]|uniref:Ubiquinone biosynthesis accessory factor UbiJ n=1 Tax=BD1-7 clade bacterium TaxID=2029982 RepID=A0A5S9MR42_9GAMM|nr:Uncharacterised protein [BD1-7 clade bacterium]CAA0084585.1 Uncharacterised protein [BD1-7 clade bacterium]